VLVAGKRVLAIPTGVSQRKVLTATTEMLLTVDGLSGYLVGMTANVTQLLGLPDAQKFPQYGADSIYTWRASKAGIGVYILGAAIALVSGYPANSFPDFYDQQTNKSWHQMFASIKSPYQLTMRYFYYTTKYNLVYGLCIWLVRGLSWQLLWLWLECKQLARIFSSPQKNAS